MAARQYAPLPTGLGGSLTQTHTSVNASAASGHGALPIAADTLIRPKKALRSSAILGNTGGVPDFC